MDSYFRKILIVLIMCFLAGCSNKSNPTAESNNCQPACSITSPASSADYYLGEEIEITAEASDSDGDISVVRFLIDGTTVSKDSTAPYSCLWDTEDEDYGSHQIRVIAYDDMNSSSSSNKVITLNYLYEQPEQIDDGWEISSLNNEGLDSVLISNIMNDLVQGDHDYIRSLLIARNGKLVLEHYRTDLSRNTFHHMQSATKSVASALIGIAIDRGNISGIDVPIFDLFPEHEDIRTPEKNLITLEHILTMTPGLEWNETSVSTFAGNNDNMIGHQVPSYLEYALSKPVLYPPGTTWFYNSGCSIMLGGVIRNTTGMQAVDFAMEYLFGPLDIEYYQWLPLTDGVTGTHGALFMRSRDQAKIGQLFMNNGIWNGNRIISEEWVQNSTEPYISRHGHSDYQYAYQWWVDIDEGLTVYYACGYGGQRIFVIPDLDMVVVTTADYDNEEGLNEQINYIHSTLYHLIANHRIPDVR
ncbi:MAG: serine hydrolase [bacterium]|nr:serine hydrolase [bacterium]